MTLDLERYLERIGWTGGLAPSFETLAGLVQHHIIKIPFENLDVLLGRPVSLDLENLQAKLVTARRGGYCYEHATLFAAVLERLGFTVHMHSARVIMATAKSASPRTHMLLSVELPQGTFVVDPGFGGLAPMVPVPLDGTPVRHGTDEHWLERDGADYTLEVRTLDQVGRAGQDGGVGQDGGHKVVDAWVSTLARDFPIDFVMANHFTSTHPLSGFTRRLMMRTFTPTGRITIMNREVTHWRGSESQPSQLADRSALRDLVTTAFGFELPEITTMRVSSIPEWT